MEVFVTVAQVVAPIFAAIFLGILAKKKTWVTAENVQGYQKFVMKIGLPCVVFNSCLTAKIGLESLTSMGLILPALFLATLWAFRARKKRYPYHNLPMLFCAQESGMLGIPLFIILFGADQAYRVGILDLTQAVLAFPVIAILSADTGNNPSVPEIIKKVISSPLMIMSFLGLTLNISGIGAWMDQVGIGGILTETTTFLSTPVSALMIFSVGYNFSISDQNRSDIFKLCAVHSLTFALIGGILQLALFLLPGITSMTRWAVLLFSFLPASYLAPGLGRSEQDHAVSSGVCSLLTIVTLVVFCIIAALTA